MRVVWPGYVYVVIENNELSCFENVSNIGVPAAMACSELEFWNLERFSMIYAENSLLSKCFDFIMENYLHVSSMWHFLFYHSQF